MTPVSGTSADAAGLPILPGPVRYEEVAAGRIDHPIRVAVPRTRDAYLWPARHAASDSDFEVVDGFSLMVDPDSGATRG